MDFSHADESYESQKTHYDFHAFNGFVERASAALERVKSPDVVIIGERPATPYTRRFLAGQWENCYIRLITLSKDLESHSLLLQQVGGSIAERFWIVFGKNLLFEAVQELWERNGPQTLIAFNWFRMGTELMEIIYGFEMPDWFFKPPEACPICLEDMFSPAETPCKHLFHLRCLRNWMAQSPFPKCPCCRHDI